MREAQSATDKPRVGLAVGLAVLSLVIVPKIIEMDLPGAPSSSALVLLTVLIAALHVGAFWYLMVTGRTIGRDDSRPSWLRGLMWLLIVAVGLVTLVRCATLFLVLMVIITGRGIVG